MAEVSIRELKSHLSEHLRLVAEGERITITRRGKPVGRIVPELAPEETDEERIRPKLQDLAARGLITRVPEGKPKGLAKPVKLIGEGPTVSEMVLGDRSGTK
jgi:prevent-host-death family protein